MPVRWASRGASSFGVIADGKTLFKSGVMRPGDAAKTVDVDLSGVKLLLLFVGSAGDGISYDHANWADAKFVVSGEKPKAIDAPARRPSFSRRGRRPSRESMGQPSTAVAREIPSSTAFPPPDSGP